MRPIGRHDRAHCVHMDTVGASTPCQTDTVPSTPSTLRDLLRTRFEENWRAGGQ